MVHVILQVHDITHDCAHAAIAPKMFANDYVKVQCLVLTKRYYGNTAWYSAIQNQRVGRR